MVTPQRIAKILVALWLTIATFKIAWFPIGPGLDPSWLYGINYFADVPNAFGRDMAFTWGPLGYLLSALPIGEHVTAAMITALIISGLFALALLHWAWHDTKVWQFILFAVVFQFEACWPYLPERLLSLTLILWAAIALEPGYASALLVVAFIAGVSIFVKWNVGLAAISILLAAGAYVVYRDRRRGVVWVGAAVGLFALLASVLASALFADAAAVARWLRSCAHLTSGYSEAMSLMPATGIESGTPQLLALFAWVAGVLAYKRSPRAIFLGVISFTLFMFIKHGFVRHDTPHIASFATAFIGVVAVLLLSSRKTFELRLCTGVLLAMVAVQLMLLPRKDIGIDRIVKKLVGVQGVEALADILQPAQTKQRLRAATQTQLAGRRLPDTWLASIAQHGNGLMPLPSELSFCAANPVTCKPLAVLQTYSAYTSALDTWSAERVAAADAPGAVLLGYDAIDDRQMFFDAPALWREIINRYEVTQNAPAFMLLTRRAQPADATLRDLGAQQVPFGDWVDVAPTLNLTYARLHVGLSALGMLTRFAWGVPPLGIHLVFEDGTALAYRLVRDVAQDGLLINYVPRNLHEVYDLMASQSTHRVVQFRIVSAPENQKYFASEVKVEWLQSPQKIFLQRNSVDRDLSQATLPSTQPRARAL